jgi:dTDP-4-amino-4,6-dideoxygalactose transaminase
MAPDAREYNSYLERILASRHMTNHGSCVKQLEKRLASWLNIPHLACCANGTLALQLGLHAVGLAGKEVVTTPFSYVATLSALLWEGCTVIFADIDEEDCCLDPKSVADRLTPDTAGILPVHVYGNVCDVETFDALAKAHALTLLYDAAQAFGSEYRGRSVLDYGDCSACSTHATKIFHTVEGGFLAGRNGTDIESFTIMRACGHWDDNHIRPGINAKLSELHAAMGLCLLDKVADNIAARKKVSLRYDALLPREKLRRPRLRDALTYNYAYYPVIFESEGLRQQAMSQLGRENIHPRRYFFPALNTLHYLKRKQSCPVAESVARRVLCLPLFAEMEEESVALTAKILTQVVGGE